MNYKYRKGQILGKRLNIPKNILNKVYNRILEFNEYVEYGLYDKIPTTCLREPDKNILEKFGFEKCRELDWELINKNTFYNDEIVNIIEILMSMDETTEDVNNELYEIIKDKIKPSQYSDKMKRKYKDRLFCTPNASEDESVEYRFNNGLLSLKDIVNSWDIFKNKDLSFCLLNDKMNINNITDEELKKFMEEYEDISNLIIEKDDIYTFITTLKGLDNDREKFEFVKKFAEKVLKNPIIEKRFYSSRELSNEEYKALFKYVPFVEYIKEKHGSYAVENLLEELKTLPDDFIYNSNIPVYIYNNSDAIKFINTYGLKNVVDFDNECGNFFSNNNCETLKLMFDMYLHYNSGDKDRDVLLRTIFYDKNGNYEERPYTKDEFYEAMRRMIVYGPSDWNYTNKALDYREITGEFKKRNQKLFISDEAPDELKQLFYTKSLTPKDLSKNPEYISFLIDKDLRSCFKERIVRFNDDSNYENLYSFLIKKAEFEEVLIFLKEYAYILDIIYDRQLNDEVFFSKDDDFEVIKNKIEDLFIKLLIEKRCIYPQSVPENIIKKHPDLFLPKDAPQELKEALYDRTINIDFILKNPSYVDYLKKLNIEILFKFMPVTTFYPGKEYNYTNIVKIIKDSFKEDAFDFMLMYGNYLDKLYEQHILDTPKEDIWNSIDENIYKGIIEGKIKYDENISAHFKKKYNYLFLDEKVPDEIRKKFYNREFTLEDFIKSPDLINIFENTNVICGLDQNAAWIIPVFSNLDNKIANNYRLKIYLEFKKIEDVRLQKDFKDYIIKRLNSINIEKIEYISQVIYRLSKSNSSEIYAFRHVLINQILDSDDPLDSLEKVEEVFISNNIPTVGKIYSCFESLHPDFKGFDFENSHISPVLKKSSTLAKKVIVFSDLIKASFGSNNRSVISYINNIEDGYNIYLNLKNNNNSFETLNDEEKNVLTAFAKHLTTLYNNTLRVKKEKNFYNSSGDIIKDIDILAEKLSPDGSLNYNLTDRVIKMFCGFVGIDTLEEAKNYIREKINSADIRNRKAAESDMTLEKGDFIKGIGDITYLRDILQNGSVSKEYLGSSAGSDSTPLDTDISMVLFDGSNSKKLFSTEAKSYGPIWFVLKNDDRFTVTRDEEKTYDEKRDLSKYEVFYTGVLGYGHYGIRTGFPSSEINYIMVETYDSRIGLEIAMNGFYIPVVDTEGKILFTPNDYDKLREKMNGLSHYNMNSYEFSNNLITNDTLELANQIEQSNIEISNKRDKINNIIKKSISSLGLKLKSNIDGDLTEGSVELIDTGSTGRGTNKPGDGDFDFIVRLDRSILTNKNKLSELKQTLLDNFGESENYVATSSGDFRLKGVHIDEKTIVDIDLTFTAKTDKLSYSTDMSLQDRLDTIKKVDYEKYKYVVANILLAKKVLKEANVYKPDRGETPQGGLGGVGIENWILQNGGSFIDAAESFVNAAEGKDFTDFIKEYQIWDFGDNHLAEKKGLYPHDNFVENNMSEVGYTKMLNALKNYLNTVKNEEKGSLNK